MASLPARFRTSTILLALLGLLTGLAGCGSGNRASRTSSSSPAAKPAGRASAARSAAQASTGPTGPHLDGGPTVSGAGGKFAGFVYQGAVHSIAGSWRVPTVAKTSRLGKASTWIGAQAPGSTEAPFIQLGTQEEMRAGNARGRSQRFYEAFFSDSQRAFHPYSLFAVHAGDELTATMKLVDQRWYLSIIDLSSGASDHFSTAEEGTGQFNYGLWLQEDVTNTKINVVFPYPDVSAAQLSGLSVNGISPSYGQLLSTWMALPGGYLGPTPLSDGAFEVVPQTLSTAGARYLTIAARADQQASTFESDVDNWATSTPAVTVRRETDAFVSDLKATVSRLKAVSWPARVANLIGRIEFNDDFVVQSLQLAAAGGVVRVYQTLTGLESKLSDADDTRLVRRGLNVEQLAY